MEEPKTMSKGQFKRYQSFKISIKCVRCAKEIWPGQLYIKKHTTRTRLYHFQCYEELFFESEDEVEEKLIV